MEYERKKWNFIMQNLAHFFPRHSLSSTFSVVLCSGPLLDCETNLKRLRICQRCNLHAIHEYNVSLHLKRNMSPPFSSAFLFLFAMASNKSTHAVLHESALIHFIGTILYFCFALFYLASIARSCVCVCVCVSD